MCRARLGARVQGCGGWGPQHPGQSCPAGAGVGETCVPSTAHGYPASCLGLLVTPPQGGRGLGFPVWAQASVQRDLIGPVFRDSAGSSVDSQPGRKAGEEIRAVIRWGVSKPDGGRGTGGGGQDRPRGPGGSAWRGRDALRGGALGGTGAPRRTTVDGGLGRAGRDGDGRPLGSGWRRLQTPGRCRGRPCPGG